jgi:hypothetical protein
MRTSEERIAELHRRMRVLAGEKQLCFAFTEAFAVCLIAVILFAVGISRVPMVVAFETIPASFSASIFSNHAALKYIVVGIVALCLGILITLFCSRVKYNMEKEEESDDRKH